MQGRSDRSARMQIASGGVHHLIISSDLTDGAHQKRTSVSRPMPVCLRYAELVSKLRRLRRGHKSSYRERHVMNEEQRITVCKTGLNQIYDMLRSSPQNWRGYLTLARSVIAHLDSTSFMQQASRTSEQAWMVAGLQRLAQSDVENGGVPDITAWCSRQWMAIYQRDSQNIAALRGIGQAWLSRAQPILARIHRLDGNSSSSGSGSQRSRRSGGSEDRQSASSVAEAERRAGTQDYVEAQGLLQPATEYLERAIAVATEQRALSGDLLATTAEAYMSLGNASSPRTNEQYFRRALQLLRAASQVPGYSLSRYLQQYLEEYGRLID